MNFHTQLDNHETGTQDTLPENSRTLRYLAVNYGLSSLGYFVSLHDHPFLIQGSEQSKDKGALALLDCPVHYLKKRVERKPDRILLGRLEDNDICIPFNRVSGHHAYFEKRQEAWCIVDDNSRNGVFVNGRRLDSNAPFLLKSGINIHFGRSLGVRFIGPEAMFEYILRIYETGGQFPAF
jgi:hypothetical protein